MKLDKTLQQSIKFLVNKEVIEGEIKRVYPISGGSVNRAYGIDTERNRYFIKLNQERRFPEMFSKEVKGLSVLRACKALRIPEVIYEGSVDDTAFLVLELIEEGTEHHRYWEELGEGLAQIHKNSHPQFGLTYNNYNGSLTQSNEWKETWEEFFFENRINFQLKMATDAQRVGPDFVKLFEKALTQLRGIFPEEAPALLHGDLWSGNFITDEKGKPVLIDPAVYYGHREVDLSMSMLFGGFHRKFYESYQAVFPLEEDWETRVDILNLYPLMVHVNLFGASYAQRVKGILKKWA